jgi:hypothetical protein
MRPATTAPLQRDPDCAPRASVAPIAGDAANANVALDPFSLVGGRED